MRRAWLPAGVRDEPSCAQKEYAVPEMPEVEVVCRQLTGRLDSAVVVAVTADPNPKFASSAQLRGAQLGHMVRRGKFLLLPTTDGREAIIHLGMTGVLALQPCGTPSGPHTRVDAQVRLNDGTLAQLQLADVRKFGRFEVVTAGEYRGTLAGLGPEIDAACPAQLHAGLQRRSAAIKTVLLGQKVLAGVGNWMADEALHRAGVAPQRPAGTLTVGQASDLLDALRSLVATAIAAGGTSFSDFRQADGYTQGTNAANLVVYGRGGLPCLTCGTALQVATVGGRTSVWCADCQA
jgi:formamidopyrimidine-DNA glycosylase